MRFILWRDADRPYLGLLVALVVALAAIVAIFYVLFTSARVDGESMLPALFPEDRVLITRGYDEPRVGDIVSVDIVTEQGLESVLKRVAALPGDEVAAQGDLVWVNGDLSQAAPEPIIDAELPVFDPVVVPAGEIYLLGDNRPVSLDSRFIGPVPLSQVTGRVVAIFSPANRWRIVD